MDDQDATEQSEAAHREVVAVLDSGREAWWQAERVVGLMCGYEHIAGQRQDAGDDRPFDLRSPGDRIRVDVKTQRGNELDVKKEKPGSQFAAWNATGRRFVPLQLVLDSLSEGGYLVPGIPLRTADAVLDPLVTRFDPADPAAPFLVGKCLLAQLRQKERFDDMVTRLKEALDAVEQHREPIQAAVDEAHLRYVASVAEDTLVDRRLMNAILGKVARSDEAMGELARSDEAMGKLAQSDDAMSKLGRSDEAMSRLAQSDEAMGKLAQSDEALASLMKAAKNDPGLRARLLALLGGTEADDSPSPTPGQ
jgi:hypothetical protein